jgi:hypoxanthine phosphoribosyltransferase
MSTVRIKDKYFKLFIQADQIAEAVNIMAGQINVDLQGKKPLFIAVLNGSFLFAADLLRKIKIECEISFVKLSSYQGLGSTGDVKQLFGLSENLEGRTVVILEDIVDTGNTLDTLIPLLKSKKAADVKVAALLYKPQAYRGTYGINYTGLEVPNDFLVGYGLDYDGQGRNLEHIYILTTNP